jgi:5'-3' exoribonuclease 1
MELHQEQKWFFFYFILKNQQRSRRFRASKAAYEEREEAIKNGEEVLDDGVAFDSNCITPGTDFMANLTKYLNFFIRKKMEEDYRWKEVNIFLSGHEVTFFS